MQIRGKNDQEKHAARCLDPLQQIPAPDLQQIGPRAGAARVVKVYKYDTEK